MTVTLPASVFAKPGISDPIHLFLTTSDDSSTALMIPLHFLLFVYVYYLIAPFTNLSLISNILQTNTYAFPQEPFSVSVSVKCHLLYDTSPNMPGAT